MPAVRRTQRRNSCLILCSLPGESGPCFGPVALTSWLTHGRRGRMPPGPPIDDHLYPLAISRRLTAPDEVMAVLLASKVRLTDGHSFPGHDVVVAIAAVVKMVDFSYKTAVSRS